MDNTTFCLPNEIWIYIFKLCGSSCSIFIALSCKRFYSLIKTCLKLNTKFEDIFETDSRKQWALKLVQESICPTYLHRLYISRKSYGVPVFPWNNYDVHSIDDYVLNSYPALYVISKKIYCSKRHCKKEVDYIEHSCLHCKTPRCEDHTYCRCWHAKRSGYFQSRSSRNFNSDGTVKCFYHHKTTRTKTYRWMYERKTEKVKDSQIYEYKKLYPRKEKVHKQKKSIYIQLGEEEIS